MRSEKHFLKKSILFVSILIILFGVMINNSATVFAAETQVGRNEEYHNKNTGNHFYERMTKEFVSETQTTVTYKIRYRIVQWDDPGKNSVGCRQVVPIVLRLDENYITEFKQYATDYTGKPWFYVKNQDKVMGECNVTMSKGVTHTLTLKDAYGSGANLTTFNVQGTIYHSLPTYTLDLNGVLDGVWSGNINGFGTADVYINGTLVANDVTDFYQTYDYGTKYEIKDIKSTSGHTYNGVNSGNLSGTITGDTGVALSFSTNSYYLDLNGFLDGINSGGLEEYGTADVYINGALIANDVSDYYSQHYYGSTYEIRDIKSSTGHTYNGVNSGNLSGTITGDTNVRLSFTTNSYTNGIGHWAGGFTKSEGNNGAKNMFNITNTFFNANYDQIYTMNSSRATTVPKGFYLNETFGSGSIDGTWKSYPIGTDVKQKANVMGFEYYYYPYSYTINYSLNGGTNASNNPSNYNVLYGVTLQNPTKAGYSFVGWTDTNGKKMVGINQGANATFSSVTDMYDKLNLRQIGNVTLTANWKANTYTVEYNGNGHTGGSTASSIHTFDVSKNLTSNGYVKSGYTFMGWNTKADGSGTSYTNNASVKNLTSVNNGIVTLYAQWKINTYSINYNLNGGSVSGNPTSYTITTPTFTLKNPSKIGYTFVGWTGSNGTTPQTTVIIVQGSTGNKSYTANWKANTYTVQYNGNGHTGGSTASSTHTYDVAKNLTANGFIRTGYSFKNWNTKADGSGTSYANSASVKNLISVNNGVVTLYAQWNINAYTATFNPNGGTVPNPVTIRKNYGTALGILPITSRNGYTFEGWFTAANGGTQITSATTMPANNVTYYAHWKINTYSISYNLNGGSVSGNPTSYTITTPTFTLKNPSKIGYTFVGWTGSNGTTPQTTVSIAQGSTGNKSYTANWKANTYTVEYNGNGHTGGSTASSTHTYDVAKNLTANGFIRTGYSFKNWNTKADGSGTSYANSASVKNLTSVNNGVVTLYAQWNINAYTATFNSNGGTVPSPTTIRKNYGTALGTLPTTSRNGYTFMGWFTAANGGTQITSATTMPANNVTYYAHWEVIDPIISAKKNYYFQNEIVNINDLIKNAKAEDVVEGNISNRISVKKITYTNGEVVNNSTSKLNTSILGTIKVEYFVSTERGGKASVVNVVEIVKRGSQLEVDSDVCKIYSRYINQSAKNSLLSNSIWDKPAYKSILDSSLAKRENQYLAEYDYINSEEFINRLR